MHERVAQELAMLKQKFPLLRHGEALNWISIPEYKLPENRFNKETSKVLFNIPAGYPSTGPDNFFVDADLRLKDGSNPLAFNLGSQSSSGPAIAEGNWAWFSWHPQVWRPAATIEGGDNLLTFIRGINMCLRGEEAK